MCGGRGVRGIEGCVGQTRLVVLGVAFIGGLGRGC